MPVSASVQPHRQDHIEWPRPVSARCPHHAADIFPAFDVGIGEVVLEDAFMLQVLFPAAGDKLAVVAEVEGGEAVGEEEIRGVMTRRPFSPVMKIKSPILAIMPIPVV